MSGKSQCNIGNLQPTKVGAFQRPEAPRSFGGPKAATKTTAETEPAENRASTTKPSPTGKLWNARDMTTLASSWQKQRGLQSLVSSQNNQQPHADRLHFPGFQLESRHAHVFKRQHHHPNAPSDAGELPWAAPCTSQAKHAFVHHMCTTFSVLLDKHWSSDSKLPTKATTMERLWKSASKLFTCHKSCTPFSSLHFTSLHFTSSHFTSCHLTSPLYLCFMACNLQMYNFYSKHSNFSWKNAHLFVNASCF